MDEAHARIVVVVGAIAIGACGGAEGMTLDESPGEVPALYASELIAFEPGDGAGFGQDQLPDIVLGPPVTDGDGGGSLDVLSLGVGGSVVVGFSDRRVVDGPEADFVVFENAFAIRGNPDDPFAELGEVAVSTDAVSWHTFDCDHDGADPTWAGCAGWRVTRNYDAYLSDPLDPEVTGGDAFDLSDVGLTDVRYVRVIDLAQDGVAPSAGFDLDAIGAINMEAAR